ncbi:hypothetical protein T492DRAFT_832378 [Pavlovales sp. CCMP2436]|nr:hypothetical protein T492DRAFT_832378 [Pavlovales sp. CCMP2436]
MAPSLTVPPIPITSSSSKACPSSLTPVTPVRGSRKSPANVPPPPAPKVMTVTARALAQADLMTEQNKLSEIEPLRSQAPAWIEAQRPTSRKMDLLAVTDLNHFIADSQNRYRSSFLANAQVPPDKSQGLVQEEALLKISKAFKGSKQAVSIEQKRVDDAASVAAGKKAVVTANRKKKRKEAVFLAGFTFRFFSRDFAFRFFSRALPSGYSEITPHTDPHADPPKSLPELLATSEDNPLFRPGAQTYPQLPPSTTPTQNPSNLYLNCLRRARTFHLFDWAPPSPTQTPPRPPKTSQDPPRPSKTRTIAQDNAQTHTITHDSTNPPGNFKKSFLSYEIQNCPRS